MTGVVDVVRERLEAAGFVVTIDGRITEAAAAALIGLEPRTLRNWRCLGKGPPVERLFGRAWYPLEPLLGWLQQTRDHATSRSVTERHGAPSTSRRSHSKL